MLLKSLRLKELSLHLEEMSKVHGVGSISGRMLIDLKRWFQFVTDTAAPNFDPVYVTGFRKTDHIVTIDIARNTDLKY